MRAIAHVLLSGFLLGCFADRAAIDPGGPRPDSGSPSDSGSPQDGAPCTGGSRCEGEVALTCAPEGMRSVDCAAQGAYCEGGACVPWVCTPSASECSADGAGVVMCDARGTAPAATMACARGCDSGACREPTTCSLALDGTIAPGEALSVNLCQGGNDEDRVDAEGDGCIDLIEANGPDRIVRLEIDRPGRFRLELSDDDPDRQVDPVVYVRRECAVASTQLGCDSNGFGGLSLDARLDIDLAAGDYFVVLDSYTYDVPGIRARCGQVRLAVARLD